MHEYKAPNESSSLVETVYYCYQIEESVLYPIHPLC